MFTSIEMTAFSVLCLYTIHVHGFGLKFNIGRSQLNKLKIKTLADIAKLTLEDLMRK